MKDRRKAAIISAIVVLIMPVFFNIKAYASGQTKENHLEKDTITAVVEDDGDVRIKEIWEGDFNIDTECYINKLSDTQIEDFKVAINGKPMKYRKKWNIDDSFSDKAYRYGIYNEDYKELCFGISKYGHNVYTIEYTMKKQAHKYHKIGIFGYACDGFNIRFFNEGMNNVTPTDVDVTVSLDNGKKITEDMATIYSFGFKGKQKITDGVIKVKTTRPIFYEDEYMTVMASMDKNTFPKAKYAEHSWKKTYKEALKDSEYEDDSSSDEDGTEAIITIVVFAFFAVIVIIGAKQQKKDDKMKLEYWNSLPIDSKVPVTLNLAETAEYNYMNENGFFLAVIFYLVSHDCLECIIEYNEIKAFKIKNRPDTYDPSINDVFNELEKLSDPETGMIYRESMMNRKFGDKIITICRIDGGFHRILKYPWHKSMKESDRKKHFEAMCLRKFLLEGDLEAASGKDIDTMTWYIVYSFSTGVSSSTVEYIKSKLFELQYTDYNNDLDRSILLQTQLYQFLNNMDAFNSFSNEFASGTIHETSSYDSSSGGGGDSSGGGYGGGTR